MPTGKLAASEIKAKLEKKKKAAREVARLNKIKIAGRQKELERIAAEKKAEEDFLNLLLREIAEDAVPLALDGAKEMGLDGDIYSYCHEYLEKLGFDFGYQDLETYSIIFLRKKLKSMDRNNLNTLHQSLLENINKFISESDYELRNSLIRISKEIDPIVFCEKYLLYSKKLLQDSTSDILDSPVNSFFLQRISSIVNEFIPYNLEQDEYLTSLKWDKNIKLKSEDFWFNVATLYWISSKNGKVFFENILSHIDYRVGLLRSNIIIKVMQQKSKVRIEFDDKSFCYTPLKLSHLISVFEILGYELKVTYPKNQKLPIKIKLIWS